MTTAILSLVLGLTPPATSPSVFDVSDAEIELGERSLHLSTFDADGDQSAEVVLWADNHDRVHMDANFADGLYVSALVSKRGELLAIESGNPEETVERMTAIGEFLGVDQPQEGEMQCLASVVAASGCLVGNMIGCIPGSIGIACYCLPLLGDYP